MNFFLQLWLRLSPYKTPKKAFHCLYLHSYAFLKGETPYILVFDYNIFRHISYLNFDGTAKYVKPRLQLCNAVHSVKQHIKNQYL
jgi:hypothetical protein